MLNNTSQNLKNNYNQAYTDLEQSEIDTAQNDILQDIQGNILKSHGRTYSIYLFLHFDIDRAKATKKWIGDFGEKYIVSAIKQQEQSQEYKKFLKKNKATPHQNLFVNFSLSFKGYEALRLDAKSNFRKPHQQKIKDIESPFPSQHPFEQGMLASLNTLKDNVKDCEPEYLHNEIHALISLADSDPKSLWQETNKIIAEIKANKNNIEIIKKEIGLIRRNDLNQPIEPFGFPDGISQPLFFKPDIDKVKNTDKWCPSAKLRLVLNVDPFGKRFEDKVTGDKYSFGSFLVYRKLEQNVDGFNNRVRELACELENKETDCQPKEETEQLTRAYIMGRFREDGRPVAIYSNLDSSEENGIELNNFNYGKEKYFTETSRWKCPFHAHVRKVNSRAISDEVYSLTNYEDRPEDQRRRRIVRRGTTYGLPKENYDSPLSESTKEDLKHYQNLSEKLEVKLEKGKEGILFFCFQTDIAAQFEKLQDYANDENFGPKREGNLGADPIAGQNNEEEWKVHQTWPRKWEDSSDSIENFDFFGYVTSRGGEYFFTPSLSFLKSLKEE